MPPSRLATSRTLRVSTALPVKAALTSIEDWTAAGPASEMKKSAISSLISRRPAPPRLPPSGSPGPPRPATSHSITDWWMNEKRPSSSRTSSVPEPSWCRMRPPRAHARHAPSRPQSTLRGAPGLPSARSAPRAASPARCAAPQLLDTEPLRRARRIDPVVLALQPAVDQQLVQLGRGDLPGLARAARRSSASSSAMKPSMRGFSDSPADPSRRAAAPCARPRRPRCRAASPGTAGPAPR